MSSGCNIQHPGWQTHRHHLNSFCMRSSASFSKLNCRQLTGTDNLYFTLCSRSTKFYYSFTFKGHTCIIKFVTFSKHERHVRMIHQNKIMPQWSCVGLHVCMFLTSYTMLSLLLDWAVNTRIPDHSQCWCVRKWVESPILDAHVCPQTWHG